LCSRDSKELLGICLKKLCGLTKLKLLEANFIWSEEHSKRIFIFVKVEKAINEKASI
jgi:nonsense-mediated mRNA decay protein 3